MPIMVIIIIQLETVTACIPFEKSKRLEERAEKRRKTIIVYKKDGQTTMVKRKREKENYQTKWNNKKD